MPSVLTLLQWQSAHACVQLFTVVNSGTTCTVVSATQTQEDHVVECADEAVHLCLASLSSCICHAMQNFTLLQQVSCAFIVTKEATQPVHVLPFFHVV